MILRNLFGGTALAATAFLGSMAQADVTADEVWQSWVDYYADLGQNLTTGAKERQGDTLVITNATFGTSMPEGSFTGTIGELRLKELGDGRVEMSLIGDIPLIMTTSPKTGEKVDMSLKFSQSDLKMIVSGAPEDMTYDFTAPEIAVGIAALKVDGEDVPVTMDFTMRGNKGVSRMTTGAIRNVVSDFSADSIDFNVAGSDPKSSGKFSTSWRLEALSGKSTIALPKGVDMQNMSAALKAGTVMQADFGYGNGNYVMDFGDGTQTMSASSKAAGGNLQFSLSSNGLSYGGDSGAASVSMSGGSIPFPIDFSLAQSAFKIALPVEKGDTAQPFSMVMKLVDLSVSDTIWGIFDPTAQLPHDPATLILDVTGKAKLLVDIMDPANAASPDMPGELEAVTLNELKLSAAGALLTGTGDVTVDNSAGVPKPVGTVDLALTGANALIDKLVAMGLVPQDQAMGARMMMGLFAVPTGDDALASKIEFKEDGGIYANGQRLQ